MTDFFIFLKKCGIKSHVKHILFIIQIQIMKPLNKKNYGSILHLLGSKLGQTDKYIHEGQHNILTLKTRDLHDFVTITEKYDGSNVGIAKINGKIIALTRSGYLAETSPYRQHHLFASWVKKQGNRFDFIAENERLVGEWLLQVHSIKYEINNEPFVAFDYFTADNERILFNELIVKTSIAEIETPRIIFFGYQSFSIDACMVELQNKYNHSIIAKDKPEGVVYRVERKGKFDFAAKFVRSDFKPGIFCINVEEKYLMWNYPVSSCV